TSRHLSECPLLGVKRTFSQLASMSVSPKADIEALIDTLNCQPYTSGRWRDWRGNWYGRTAGGEAVSRHSPLRRGGLQPPDGSRRGGHVFTAKRPPPRIS